MMVTSPGLPGSQRPAEIHGLRSRFDALLAQPDPFQPRIDLSSDHEAPDDLPVAPVDSTAALAAIVGKAPRRTASRERRPVRMPTEVAYNLCPNCSQECEFASVSGLAGTMSCGVCGWIVQGPGADERATPAGPRTSLPAAEPSERRAAGSAHAATLYADPSPPRRPPARARTLADLQREVRSQQADEAQRLAARFASAGVAVMAARALLPPSERLHGDGGDALSVRRARGEGAPPEPSPVQRSPPTQPPPAAAEGGASSAARGSEDLRGGESDAGRHARGKRANGPREARPGDTPLPPIARRPPAHPHPPPERHPASRRRDAAAGAAADSRSAAGAHRAAAPAGGRVGGASGRPPSRDQRRRGAQPDASAADPGMVGRRQSLPVAFGSSRARPQLHDGNEQAWPRWNASDARLVL